MAGSDDGTRRNVALNCTLEGAPEAPGTDLLSGPGRYPRVR
jgi:hypothetical protein